MPTGKLGTPFETFGSSLLPPIKANEYTTFIIRILQTFSKGSWGREEGGNWKVVIVINMCHSKFYLMKYICA